MLRKTKNHFVCWKKNTHHRQNHSASLGLSSLASLTTLVPLHHCDRMSNRNSLRQKMVLIYSLETFQFFCWGRHGNGILWWRALAHAMAEKRAEVAGAQGQAVIFQGLLLVTNFSHPRLWLLNVPRHPKTRVQSVNLQRTVYTTTLLISLTLKSWWSTWSEV